MKRLLVFVCLAAATHSSAIENAASTSPNGKTAYLRQPDGIGGYRHCTAPLLAPNCALVPLHCISSQVEGHVSETSDLEVWLPYGTQVDSGGAPVPSYVVGVKTVAAYPLDYDGFAVLGLKSAVSGSAYQMPASALPAPEALPSGPTSAAPKNQLPIQGFGRKTQKGVYGISGVNWFAFQSLPITSDESSGLTLFLQYKAPSKSLASMSSSESTSYFNSLSWAMPGDEGGPVTQGNALVGIVSSVVLPEQWAKASSLGKADSKAPYNGVLPIYPHLAKLNALRSQACPAAGNLISLSVSGTGTVSGSGILCGSGNYDCVESSPSPGSIVLSAKAASGAKFKGWSGSCSGKAATCTVSVSGVKSVGATFGK